MTTRQTNDHDSREAVRQTEEPDPLCLVHLRVSRHDEGPHTLRCVMEASTWLDLARTLSEGPVHLVGYQVENLVVGNRPGFPEEEEEASSP